MMAAQSTQTIIPGLQITAVEVPGGKRRYIGIGEYGDEADVTAEVALIAIKLALAKRGGMGRIKHWADVKRADAMDAPDWQEKHSPTVADMVQIAVIGGKRVEQQQARRRLVDARTWGALDDDLQDAAVEIERGHRALVSGMGMKPASWERIGGSGSLSSGQAQGAADYNAWVEEVDGTLKLDPGTGEPMKFGQGHGRNRWTLERLSPEAATALICHGQTIDLVSRERGKRTEWVRENLRQALIVWCYRTNRRRRPTPPIEDQDGPLTLKQLRIRTMNRRIDKMASAIEERKRVIRKP